MATNMHRKLEKGWSQLPAAGLITQGSLIQRWYTRSSKAGSRRYGPYYCWTRKVVGKTQTIALSKAQSQRLRAALHAQRRLQKGLSVLHAISEKIIRTSLPGVASRKRLPRKRIR